MKNILRVTILLGFCMLSYAKPSRFHLYIANNYLANETANRFQQQNNTKLVQSFFNEPEEMLAKLATGASGYDVVVATSYAVDALVRIDKIQPLDYSKIHNLQNVGSKYLNPDYDPHNKYSVPYAFTPVLLGYNTQKMQQLGINPNTWAVIFEPKYLKILKGHVTVLASARNVFAAALLYLNKDPNTTNVQDIMKAHELIQNAMPYWTKFDSDNYYRGLMRGDIWISMGYSEDFYKTMLDLDSVNSPIKIDAQLQKEGNMTELDNLVIMSSSKNDDLTYKFINEALSTQAQLELSTATGSSIPTSKDVTKFASYRPWMYPKHIIVFKSYPPSTRLLIDELWIEITMTCKRYD
jgi:spermidine/putrescine transport system substrate-binding protein